MNEDKPVTQENNHGILDDKTTFNDRVFSSSNSFIFVSIIFVSLVVAISFFSRFFSKLSNS